VRRGPGGAGVAIALVVIALAWDLLVMSAPAVAQRSPDPSLDGWIAARYRGAELLPDSAAAPAPLVRTGTAPRIESVREGRRVDTLLAVQFGSTRPTAILTVGTRAALAGPTGTLSPLAVQVLGRRPFRAPRAPRAAASNVASNADWLQGWAYLVTVPHVEGRPPGRYRGWTLLAAREPVPRRRTGARP
jgi:hypothetical protein